MNCGRLGPSWDEFYRIIYSRWYPSDIFTTTESNAFSTPQQTVQSASVTPFLSLCNYRSRKIHNWMLEYKKNNAIGNSLYVFEFNQHSSCHKSSLTRWLRLLLDPCQLGTSSMAHQVRYGIDSMNRGALTFWIRRRMEHSHWPRP